jgi:hypothetical protein
VTALLIAWYVAQRDIVHSADIRISPPPPAGASVPLFIATASIVLCLYGASLVASAIRGTLLHQVAILSSAGICAVCSTPAIVGQKSAWPWGGLSALAAMTLTAGAARSVQILRSPISARAVLNEG